MYTWHELNDLAATGELYHPKKPQEDETPMKRETLPTLRDESGPSFRTRRHAITAHQVTTRQLVETPYGNMMADPGYWLITRADGTTIPASPTAFRSIYEPTNAPGAAAWAAAYGEAVPPAEDPPEAEKRWIPLLPSYPRGTLGSDLLDNDFRHVSEEYPNWNHAEILAARWERQ